MSSHIVHPHFTISIQDYTAITFGTLHHRLTRRNRRFSYCTHLALSKTLLSCSVRVHVLCRRRHLPNTRSVIWKERLVLHASETQKHQRFAEGGRIDGQRHQHSMGPTTGHRGLRGNCATREPEDNGRIRSVGSEKSFFFSPPSLPPFDACVLGRTPETITLSGTCMGVLSGAINIPGTRERIPGKTR